MQVSKRLLEELQNRLKVGNRRQVHINAIPGRSRYKLDLQRFKWINENLPNVFIDQLLNQAFFDFSLTWQDNVPELSTLPIDHQSQLNQLSRAIDNLINQTEAIESEKGINTLAFGFPVLIRKDNKDGKLIAAPILIWSLKIKRSNKYNTWTIQKREDDPIYLNEVLKNHLLNDAQIDIGTLPDEWLEDGKIDKEELIKFCLSILKAVNPTTNPENELALRSGVNNIQPIFSKKVFEDKLELGSNAIIHPGGLFSIFEVQKQSIIADYDGLIDLQELDLEEGFWDNDAFQPLSSVKTDPSQQGILNALRSKRNLLIQGPPGTGKSQTLTAILVNALENQLKTLVVCEKRTALEVLQKALEEKGLNEFCILIKDSIKDRKTAVNVVRDKIDNLAKNILKKSGAKSDLDIFNLKLSRIIRVINDKHKKIGEPLLEGKNWTQIVGLLIKELREGNGVRLKMSKELFAFNEQEFNEYCNTLEGAEISFNKYKQFNPKKIWNSNRVVGDNPYTVKEQIQEDSLFYTQQAAILADEIEDYKEEYQKLRLKQFIEEINFIQSLLKSIDTIKNNNEANSSFLNERKTNGWFYQFGAIFFSKMKATLADQVAIRGLFDKLGQYLSGADFFNSNSFKNSIRENLQDIELLKSEAQENQQRIHLIVNEEIDELNVISQVVKYPTAIYKTLQERNNKLKNHLITRHWILGMDNFPNDERIVLFYKKVAEALAENLEKEESFYTAFDWFNLLKELTPTEKGIVDSLQGSTNWKRSFIIGYLDCLLRKSATNELPRNDEDFSMLYSILENIDNKQLNYIKEYWRLEQHDITKNFDKSNHHIKVVNLYNKRSSTKHKRLSLRQIIRKDIDLFTAYFPIVLTTPDVCSNLFKGKNKYFDVVLFDEASQLRLEDTLPAILKGKQRIIAGDEHQMPPSNYFNKMLDGELNNEDDFEEEDDEETIKVNRDDFLLGCESLLDFGLELNFEKQYLDFHYRSRHPYLIDFSNHAFYNGRLKPLPNKENYTPIKFIPVNGTYSESSNESEAATVLAILEKNIQKFPDGKYPTVGIATFNIGQRDLIIRKINERKSDSKYRDFTKKIGHLEENESGGLFIKNLENIQGDERDVIILSTTYGVNKEGRFYNRFGPLNQKKGYKLLNVIVSRAKYKIYVCCSIPEKYFTNYRNFLEQHGNHKRGAFFAYLAYAKAVSDGNHESRQLILNTLLKNSRKEASLSAYEVGELESIFEEEVYQRLLEKYDRQHLKIQYKYAGFRIDIVFDSLTPYKPKIAIECDGATYHSSQEAYLHDYYRQKILEDNGFVFHRIWSTNWWQNPDREMEKLCQFIDATINKNEFEFGSTVMEKVFTDDVEILEVVDGVE